MWSVFIAALGFIGHVVGAPERAFSIRLNLTGWSPMLFMTDEWDMDLATGAISSAGSSWTASNGGAGIALLWLIGTGYVPYGTVRDLAPELQHDTGTIGYNWGEGSSNAAFLNQYPEVGVIAEPSNIQLGVYFIFVNPGLNIAVTIDIITIEIPIFTAAPDETALRKGMRTSRLVEARAVNSAAFTIRQFRSHKYSRHITGNSSGEVEPVPPAMYDITNSSVVLYNYTEITYRIPANTSLVNVTGPVFPEDTNCYFLLDPEPWWWNDDVMPAADQDKPEYRAEQTLILLPTDPTAEYHLVMGAGNEKRCALSGVTVYSYNETKPADSAPNSAVSSTSTPMGHSTLGAEATTKASSSTKSSTASEKSNTPKTVGAVMGAIVGLTLLALAGLFYLRHKRKGLRPTTTASQQGSDAPPSASGFEPTEEVQVIVPFAAPSRHSTDHARRSETFDLLDSGATSDDLVTAEKHRAKSTQSQGRTSSTLSSPPGKSASAIAFGQAGASSGHRGSGSIQRADDMDGDILPPEYRDVWGQRYSANLEDAAAVTRWEKAGDRAHDGVSP